jgi:hypothetical protein
MHGFHSCSEADDEPSVRGEVLSNALAACLSLENAHLPTEHPASRTPGIHDRGGSLMPETLLPVLESAEQ